MTTIHESGHGSSALTGTRTLLHRVLLTYRHSPALLFVTLAAPLGMMLHELFWLAPVVGLVLALLGVLPGVLAPAAIATGLGVLFWGLIAFGMKAPPWYGLGFPLGAAMTLYILLRSMWRGRRQVEWRGRVYDETTGTVRE